MNKADRIEATLGSRITRNATAWRIPDRWAIALLVVPLVPLSGAIIMAGTEHPWFYALTGEDGLVEWLQIVALVAASAAFLTMAYRLRRAGGRLAPLLPSLVALGAMLVVGEEISWGQRLLGWSTPAVLDAINSQGETNIHNIGAFDYAARIGLSGAAGYGTLLPLLTLVPRLSRRLLESYVVPPLALAPYFLLPLTYWLVRIPVVPGQAMSRFSEITELSMYAGLALFGWLSVRRLAVETAHSGRNATPS